MTLPPDVILFLIVVAGFFVVRRRLRRPAELLEEHRRRTEALRIREPQYIRAQDLEHHITEYHDRWISRVNLLRADPRDRARPPRPAWPARIGGDACRWYARVMSTAASSHHPLGRVRYLRAGGSRAALTRMIGSVVAVAAIVLTASTAAGLDWFGTMEFNRLVLRISARDSNTRLSSGLDLPAYLLLRDGVPLMSSTPTVAEDGRSQTSGTLDIVVLPGETAGPAAGREKLSPFLSPGTRMYLEFKFVRGGWAHDTYETIIRIPFTIDPDDRKGMLHIGDTGTAETRWRDPKGDRVAVVTYWSGIGAPIDLRCEVIESTLGFEHQPSGMGWPLLPGAEAAPGRPTPIGSDDPPVVALYRIQREFMSLPRPLISAPTEERPRSSATVNDATGRFVRGHSRLEIVAALFPFLDDSHLGGDAGLVLSALPLVENENREDRRLLATKLRDSGYHSPQEPGSWGSALATIVKQCMTSRYGAIMSFRRFNSSTAGAEATLDDFITSLLGESEHIGFPRRLSPPPNADPADCDEARRVLLASLDSTERSAQLEAFTAAHADAASLAGLYPLTTRSSSSFHNVPRITVILGLGLGDRYPSVLARGSAPVGTARDDVSAFFQELAQECSRLLIERIERDAAGTGATAEE